MAGSSKSRLNRLQAALEGAMSSFELEGGERYYYDKPEIAVELFRHAIACARADGRGEPRPRTPEFLHILARAKDRRAALFTLYPNYFTGEGQLPPPSAFDLGALVDTGELVPQRFAEGYPPQPQEEEQE